MDLEKSKTVYCAMCADIIHKGHLNIIHKAVSLGTLTVGVLTDAAIASYKRLPYIDFETRFEIVQNIKGVSLAIAQDTLDYVPNLLRLKPDFVVHGDDWCSGVQQKTRERVIQTLSLWGGKVIDIPYTLGVSSTALNAKVRTLGIKNNERHKLLSRLFFSKDLSVFLGVYDSITASIAQNTYITLEGKKCEVDALCLLNLGEGSSKIKSTSSYFLEQRLLETNRIIEETAKPLCYSFPPFVPQDSLPFLQHSLERLEVSAIILPEENEETSTICDKIATCIYERLSNDFLIIIKLKPHDSQTATKAALRSLSYSKLGANAIIIEPKDEEALKLFCTQYSTKDTPLLCITDGKDFARSTLISLGVKGVIIANTLYDSSYDFLEKQVQNTLNSLYKS